MTTTTTAPGTELATTNGEGNKAPATVYGYIDRIKPQIAELLPTHLDAERVARLALTLVRQSELQAQKDRKPENSLAQCTPESFAGALLTAAALGLEPGVNNEAYLVPYKGECTLIIGYQGFAKLFWQHPLAKHLDAHAVHENDSFDYAYGLAQFLRHKPARADRGKVTHYYAVAELSTGASSFVVLTADEVKLLRGGKVGPSGKIPDPMRWMERKTAIRQLVKLLPKSANLAAALAVDEQSGSVLRAEHVPDGLFRGDTIPALPPSHADDREQAAADEQSSRVTAADVLDEQPAGRQQAEPEAQPDEPQTEDGLDACPACGDVPRHAPQDCPMGPEIAAAEQGD